MPEQKDLPLSELELAYINGQEHGSPPIYKDVRLTGPSQQIVEKVLELARLHDKTIRNESECKRTTDVYEQLQDLKKQLKYLQDNERRPWNHILSQIDKAVVFLLSSVQGVSSNLNTRVADWRDKVERGRQKQYEDLLREAEELEKKSKYDSDKQASRQAAVHAEEKREEAKKFEHPKPAKRGVDTIVYYEVKITNRKTAVSLPEEAIDMEPNEKWFNDQIRQAKKEGKAIPSFPGIELIAKTRVRMPR